METVTKLFEKLINLIDVKTVITFVGLGLWVYMTVTNSESEFFKTTLTMIISFYFGTKVGKDDNS